jgi:hypothetical protein
VKFKLDENLPAAIESLLARSGHDVATVIGERLGGRDDESVSSARGARGGSS